MLPPPPSPPRAQFKGIDQEFDGGDSGGGVVGDGQVDLEDQHNSATLGANRGGIAGYEGASNQVGRGNVMSYADTPDDDGGNTVSSATSSRTSSAGANYFGRSTGLAEKLIDGITDDDRRTGRLDCVRAQQKENWFNQRAIHAQNRAQGQGVVFGQQAEIMPREGGYVAREAIASAAWRKGATANEISQKDLAAHLHDLASQEAPRLDGQPWGELVLTEADQLTDVYEVRSSPRQTHVTTILVKNEVNTFAPYRCGFAATNSEAYSVSPTHGTMNRRSGEPIEVVVRYTPREVGIVHEAYLVFETEDFKHVYKFVGGT